MKFSTVKLGDYLYIKGRIGWKGLKKSEYINEGNFRIINGESLTKDGIDWSKSGFITKERYEESPEIMLQEGDILISKDGTIGKLGYIDHLEMPSTVASGIFVLRNLKPEIINTRFIYNYLSSIYFKNFITARTEGSVIPHLYQKDFVDLDFPLPKLDIQDKIVDILDAIAYKIELNNKINNNLEEQAKALYQSYFSPKSELQGKTVTLDEYCSIFTGKKNANASIDEGKYKFFTCAPDALQIDSYIFDGNAIIVSGNGAYTGRTRFYSGKFDLYQRTYACTLYDNINPDFIFPLYWFVKLELSKKIKGGTRGSAIPYIIMNDLAKFEFIYNDKLFKTFIPTFKSITETIQANELENEVLTSLRDTLLPKLMSGEIDVSNISI